MSMRASRWNTVTFCSLIVVQLWAAHALVFFAHEYAHSFVAWALGWKSDPLALHYPAPSLKVWLLQLGIDQNVDELRIFASGHAKQAALISAAGALFGNAVFTLSLGRLGYRSAQRRQRFGWALFFYWVTVASLGNLIDYVPVRTFTDGTDLLQDTFAVETGLGWSPWKLLVIAGIPTLFAMVYFFARIQPGTLHWLFPESALRRGVVLLLTSFALFCFYGAAGWSDGGPVSHRFSALSVCVLFPVMTVVS